jgi:predicted DNA-binding transcriptional regulator AlpA
MHQYPPNIRYIQQYPASLIHNTIYWPITKLEELYGISRVTAWRWARDKERQFPKPIRVTGNICLYDETEIEAWFANLRPASNITQIK